MTMCDQTELVELVEAGADELVGVDTQRPIDAATLSMGRKMQDVHQMYRGRPSQKIVSHLKLDIGAR